MSRRIDFVPLTELVAAPRNPKRHDRAGIRTSISHFGFVEVPVVDERTGRLVAGHGRVDALIERRSLDGEPPDGVQVDPGGEWLVPVMRGWASRSDADAEAYIAASNQLTVNGGWDDAELAELLADVADAELLHVTGFTDEDLQALLDAADDDADDDVGGREGLTHPDAAPDVPAAAVSRPGDVWLLGRHRVLCGDATDVEAVKAMLGADVPDCMWTDPPYGVDYVGGSHQKTNAERRAAGGLAIANDGAGDIAELLAGAFAVATVVCRPGAPVYVCHAQGELSLKFGAAFVQAGWLLRQNLVWVKDSMVLGRSDYHYRHEPILYGFTPGGEGRLGRGGPHWHRNDAQTSVFTIDRPSRSEVHPTMKPVDLVAAMLANSCPPRGLVYEPFGGSGSTLIAAHRLGMRAAVVELEPRYVDVICRRFQEFAGTLPVLASTGEAHDFTPDDDADDADVAA